MRGRTGSRRIGRVGASLALALGLVAGTVAAMPAAPASAAGETTHAWMAASAVDRVADPQLKTLLKAHLDMVRAGAFFPDTGYYSPNTFGEEPHWQRWHDALAERIRNRADCPDLTAPNGPCAPIVAFLMGAIAHGMGDEVWDWLFEPNVADLGEYYTPADLAGVANEGGAELQMDIVAIATYGAPTGPVADWPNRSEVLATFDDVDFDAVSDEQLVDGVQFANAVPAAEKVWAPTHIAAATKAMPWTSHNLITAPGGVNWAAVAIAGRWDDAWLDLLGQDPATKVSITYPAPDQRRIPATGWTREVWPGSARDRGAARTRIAVALTSAVPYEPLASSPGSIPVQQPAGSMTLVERDTGDAVPVKDGYPKAVPYGADSGEHMVDLQPAGDLKPCTWYTAGVTSALVDWQGAPVTPYSWDFRTGATGASERCPDDPYTPDEAWSRKVGTDLLGSAPGAADLQALTDRFERGLTHASRMNEVLGSAAARQRMVDEAFQRDLGRAADPSGRTYWTNRLATLALPALDANLLASNEFFRKAGGTDRTFVAALYPAALGRSADPGGAASWERRLAAGWSRASVARSLLESREARARAVKAAYPRFLGRPADPSGLARWTASLPATADPRAMWRALILSSEYQRRAEAV